MKSSVGFRTPYSIFSAIALSGYEKLLDSEIHNLQGCVELIIFSPETIVKGKGGDVL